MCIIRNVSNAVSSFEAYLSKSSALRRECMENMDTMSMVSRVVAVGLAAIGVMWLPAVGSSIVPLIAAWDLYVLSCNADGLRQDMRSINLLKQLNLHWTVFRNRETYVRRLCRVTVFLKPILVPLARWEDQQAQARA